MVKKLSSDRQILRGFGFTFIFLLLAKCIGAIKEMAVAHAYGTATEVDAYALSFAITNTPVTLTAMAGNMILIPLFVAQRREHGHGRSDNGGIILWSALMSLVISAGVFWLLQHGSYMGLNETAAAALSEQAMGMALMVPPGIIATILAARLMAGKRQISSLFEAIPSLVLICALLVFEQQLAANLLLAWFTCLGMFAYLGALLIVDRTALNDLRPRGLRLGLPPHERVREVVLILLSQTVFVLAGLVLDQLAAANLPDGQNATLAYVNRLMMLITSLGVTAVGRAVLPILAEARLDGKGEEFALTKRWTVFLFCGGIVASLIGYVVAPFGIRTLFEHGEFTAADTANVTEVFRAGLWLLPVFFPSLILSQSVVVQRRFGLLLTANLAAALSKIIVIGLFLERWGLPLIMYATVIRQIVSLMLMAQAIRPSKHEVERQK